MNILFCCAGGGSSSLFCARMVKGINANEPSLTARMDDIKDFLRDERVATSDLVFTYGSEAAVRPDTAYDIGTRIDAVLVAPQVRYRTPYLKRYLANYPTIVQDIPSRLFGMMDPVRGGKMLTGILVTLDLMRGSQAGAAATKTADKDLEILVYGASRTDAGWQAAVARLAEQGIRSLQDKYSLAGLYDFQPQHDFEVRWLFGPQVQKADIAKVARQIDGVLRFDEGPFDGVQRWYDAYKIPSAWLDLSLVKSPVNSEALTAQLLDFLLAVDGAAEATSGIQVKRFETLAPAKVAKHWGIFTWRN